jgi:preprotein translocase subunit SecY
LIIYRLGSYIPIPGIDTTAISNFTNQNSTGVLGFMNSMAGGALGRMAIFALNIMPYISSSIIMQLMTSVSPALEALKKEGRKRPQEDQSIYPLWHSDTCRIAGIPALLPV